MLDLLAAHPNRSFTLAEIARAISVSPASCHAIVTEMASRGYLVREAQRKTYILGPVPIAIGSAVLREQPLMEHVGAAAQRLSRELKLPVLVNALSGEEVVAIFSVADEGGRHAGLLAGERLPLMPPVGAPFFAWGAPERVDGWLARHQPLTGEAVVAEWRHALAAIRKRGYQIVLKTMELAQFSWVMQQMAAGTDTTERKEQMLHFSALLDRQLIQPDEILDDRMYDIASISAPIFDSTGAVLFCMGLGGFTEKVSGQLVKSYAQSMMTVCVEVMQVSRRRV